MSASTVSITANPTAARRRTVVTVEKKSNVELVAADQQFKSGEDKSVAGNGRDHSHHSVRGDAVLERTSRDAVQQIKKAAAATSTVSPPPTARRGRKPVAAPKPKWVTVLSVFSKNFLILVLLAGLVQIVRRLALGSAGDGAVSFAASDFEGRIAEVERFVKTTTKMIQVQVEVVDRKIGSEIREVREEIGKRLEAESAVLEGQLKEITIRSDGLEKSIGELKDLNWLSKDEFETIVEELKKGKSGDGALGETNLNEVRAYARNVVIKEIEKHAADGLGKADYASASGGGVVVKHSDPYTTGKGSNWFAMSARTGVHYDAEKMLKPSFGEPGQCFPLIGSNGFVQIRLRTAIIPEAVTLEHVAESVAFDRSSAPKNCRISGWLQESNTEEVEKMFLLTEFTYDLEKSNAQTFEIQESAASGVINNVRFDFTSNHGSPSHTCIYRLRVHGHEPYSVSTMPMQS